MNLDELLTSFKDYAFRLETLPVYSVPFERSAIDLFASSGQLPDDFNREWADLLEDHSREGRSVKRLRLLSEPMTEYERFEVAAYQPGIDAGEQIRHVPRAQFPELEFNDFWLFDGSTIAWLDYSDLGEYRGVRVENTLELPTIVTRSLEVFDLDAEPLR